MRSSEEKQKVRRTEKRLKLPGIPMKNYMSFEKDLELSHLPAQFLERKRFIGHKF